MTTINEAQLAQIESAILQIYLPELSKPYRKALRKLCKEKGLHIFSYQLQRSLNNLLASIIRHRETNYDSIIAAVGKKRARFYTQHIVSQGLE